MPDRPSFLFAKRMLEFKAQAQHPSQPPSTPGH
jgi:hypothetical protein